MTLSEQPPGTETGSQSISNKDTRAIFAIASLVIGILDLPALFCGWLFAFAFGAGGDNLLFIISITAPILLCFAGVASGIVGLRSKRRVIAIIGIALSGLFLLLVFGFFGFTVFVEPNTLPILSQ